MICYNPIMTFLKDATMRQTINDRKKLISQINHSLQLEGIFKNDFQKELDQKIINGQITPDESFQLILQHEGIIKKQ